MAVKKGEKIKSYILIGVLLMALLLAYFRFIHKKGPRPVTPTATPTTAAPLILPDVPRFRIQGKGDQKMEAPTRESLGTVIRDIFTPLSWPKKKEPPPVTVEESKPKPLPVLELKGTIVGPKKAMAIINGQYYRIGDMIGDFRIVDISKNKVMLRSDDRQIDLEALEVSKE